MDIGSSGRRSREETAKAEIGHTAVTPATARTFGVLFLVLVTALPLIELAAGRTPWASLAHMAAEATAAQSLFDGNRVVLQGLHHFEEALEDESRLGLALRPRAQQILSGWLGAGNEQAYIGRDGWLFYRRDVEYITGAGFLREDVRQRRLRNSVEWATPPQPDPRPAILQLHRELAARGITLIVMPVPVKPTIHPEMLADRDWPTDQPPDNPDFGRLVEDLREVGVIVFSPRGSLAQARQITGASQYLATDTHWRPEAMELVAGQLATEIRQHVQLPARPDIGYRTQAAEVSSRGDIFGMLDLGERQALYPPETVTIRQVLQADGSPWRPSPEADVLLLGDSFANIYALESMGWGTNAGLAEHVAHALRRPVDRMVQNDAGSHATREMLARAEPLRLAPKLVVIYQFAARELAFGDWKPVDLPLKEGGR